MTKIEFNEYIEDFNYVGRIIAHSCLLLGNIKFISKELNSEQQKLFIKFRLLQRMENDLWSSVILPYNIIQQVQQRNNNASVLN